MSVHSSIESLNQHLSEAFSNPSLPPGWENEWLTQAILEPREASPSKIEEVLLQTSAPGENPPRDPASLSRNLSLEQSPSALDFPEVFPGFSSRDANGGRPPTDEYVLYLPFHLYWDRGWGIYLVTERYNQLAQDFYDETSPDLTEEETYGATRLYLYEHGYFHHNAETFSSRVEAVTREKVYLQGQRRLYENKEGNPTEQLEEVLAEAYALRRVKKRLKSKKSSGWAWPEKKREAFLGALKSFMREGTAAKRGLEVHQNRRFKSMRNTFSEQILSWSPVEAEGKPAGIWSMFSHGFHGLANISSNVKYLVRKSSPLSERNGLDLEPVRSDR